MVYAEREEVRVWKSERGVGEEGGRRRKEEGEEGKLFCWLVACSVLCFPLRDYAFLSLSFLKFVR